MPNVGTGKPRGRIGIQASAGEGGLDVAAPQAPAPGK